jgi:hypothetical protein
VKLPVVALVARRVSEGAATRESTRRTLTYASGFQGCSDDHNDFRYQMLRNLHAAGLQSPHPAFRLTAVMRAIFRE